MALTKAKVSFVEGVDGAVLTGAMPAVDGASLTGISGMTKTTSDPLITTNPATGVGTVWLNKSTSELFGCTDATTDENVWVNIGGGEGDVEPWVFQGTLEGYVSAGQSAIGQPVTNTIQKFSFASNTTGTNLGDLTKSTHLGKGTSSRTHGYHAGGIPSSTVIDKFQFATANNSTTHGNLSTARHSNGASNSETDGFAFGGQSYVSTIDKYAFASNTTAATHGNLTEATNAKTGNSSETHGFASGGYNNTFSPAFQTTIDKFAFASNTTAASHGDLVVQRSNASGTSSTTHGYVAGGADGSVDTTTIDKFAFASNTTATSHGNLTFGRDGNVGSSHTTHGYNSGGQRNTGPVNAHINLIDKYAFATNTTAIDHGDLVQGSYAGSGHQF